jgi:putative transposase
VPWIYTGTVGAPFADFTWRQARRVAVERGEDQRDEAGLARILDELLQRTRQGPAPTDRALTTTLARDRSAASLPLRPVQEPSATGMVPGCSGTPLGQAIPP